jgi:hypothetical protein
MNDKEEAHAALATLRAAVTRYADTADHALLTFEKREGLERAAIAREKAHGIFISFAPLVATIEWDAVLAGMTDAVVEGGPKVSADRVVAAAERLTRVIEDAVDHICRALLTENN